LGVPDEKWGERPLAVVVPREEVEGQIMAEALGKYMQSLVTAHWA
jgi:acyl-CoA synthetase (AMP-forming)/AMP-acid ligase II